MPAHALKIVDPAPEDAAAPSAIAQGGPVALLQARILTEIGGPPAVWAVEPMPLAGTPLASRLRAAAALSGGLIGGVALIAALLNYA